jgi:hypothetical protein
MSSLYLLWGKYLIMYKVIHINTKLMCLGKLIYPKQFFFFFLISKKYYSRKKRCIKYALK